MVPCYNEQDNLDRFVTELKQILRTVSNPYEILFIDDGSNDDSLSILGELARQDRCIKVIALSRNFGKEAALTAGLDYATGDAVIPVDADLQDPLELIPQMLLRWRSGADMVLAQRISRKQDGWFKRWSAQLFYRVMRRLSKTPMPRNVGDFRLMDRQVVDAIRQLPERTRFMKGLFSWPGFHTEVIEFSRPGRHAGHSKWNLWRLFNHALDGLFSFSTAPLRMWTYIGFLISLFSLAYLLFLVFKTFVYGVDVPGYASIVSIILFFSGINLIGLGILGEYLGRVFIEVKQRPVYLVKQKIGF